jgi:hypothetical protein
MALIGIIGARKFKDRKSVKALVASLPKDSIIVTGACAGVCKWAQRQTSHMNMEVLVFKLRRQSDGSLLGQFKWSHGLRNK